MNETEFNLLDEPWIRVMDDNCQIKEVSLTDALLNAHKYKALKGEMPTQDIVILRLMLAIVHTVFSRVDADGNEAELEEEDDALDRWESLWNNRKIPEKPVREYLEKWHERFWLFHTEQNMVRQSLMARYQKVATKLGYFLHIQANRKATLHMLRRLGGFCTSTLLMTHQQSLPKRVRQEQAANCRHQAQVGSENWE